MVLDINILFTICIIGATQQLILGTSFLSIKGNSTTSNMLFGIFLIICSISTFSHILYKPKHFSLLPFFFYFALGPLLYLHIYATNKKVSYMQIVHFTPLVLAIPILKLNYPIELDNFIKRGLGLYLIIHTYTYIIISIVSYIKLKNSQPMKHLDFNFTPFRIATALIVTILFTIIYFSPLRKHLSTLYPAILSISSLPLFIIGFTLVQKNYTDKTLVQIKKYKTSPLTSQMCRSILDKLNKVMKEEKLFLDSSLSLPLLSQRIGTSKHLLSQILNEKLETNFFNYVSSLRVNEAKKQLINPKLKNETMSEIAYSVGFNSLSSFNGTFKKHTQMSPSQFKKNHLLAA